jgi:hypothetical protein
VVGDGAEHRPLEDVVPPVTVKTVPSIVGAVNHRSSCERTALPGAERGGGSPQVATNRAAKLEDCGPHSIRSGTVLPRRRTP